MTRRNYSIGPEDSFQQYEAMGRARRSLARLAEELAAAGQPVPLKTLEYWSRRHGWQARLAELDAAASERGDAEITQRRAEARPQLYALGAALIGLGCGALLATPIEELKPSDASRLVREGRALVHEVLAELVDADPPAERIVVLDLDGDDALFVGEDADAAEGQP